MIGIVIVNWNSGDQLEACINSILMYGGSYVEKIIVVDNDSKDGSARRIKNHPSVEIIYAGLNLGFGKACNRGAAFLSSKYFLFLNPDARLYANTLSGVVDFLEKEECKDIGICGVKLIDDSGRVSRSCSRFPGAMSFVAHSLGVDKLFPSLSHLMAEWDHLQSRQVDHVIGAFFMVRGIVFEKINGFDESFFLYLEDLDFSLRAHRAGWSTFYLASVEAFHYGGGTSKAIRSKRLFYSVKSRLNYARLHFSWILARMVGFAALIIEPISRIIFCLIRLSFVGVNETLVAYKMLWIWVLKSKRAQMERK